MAHSSNKIDWDGFLRDSVAVQNADGRRAYDRGVRVFNCPLCDDDKGRGWANVVFGAAGCFNAGCEADPRLPGGLLEWARIRRGDDFRGETYMALVRDYPGTGDYQPPESSHAGAYNDWAKLPGAEFPEATTFLDKRFIAFAQKQWGLSVETLRERKARRAVSGRYKNRIVFPIEMGRRVVGFQARSIVPAPAKYLTSRHGPKEDPSAECGRPAEAMLYGFDDVRPGSVAVLVEGIADAISYNVHNPGLGTAFAILGLQLTSEKLAILAERTPLRVVVALDSEPATFSRALTYLDQLEAWGVPAALGRWVGGKDAGSGATLEAAELSLSDRVEARLKGTVNG